MVTAYWKFSVILVMLISEYCVGIIGGPDHLSTKGINKGH